MSGEQTPADSAPDSASETPASEPSPIVGDPTIGDAEMANPVATRVFKLLAPVVATADVELLDVEWTGGTLRVVLDHENGVNTDSLTSVNRLISPILDQHDPVPGRYTLEVSSPGVERPLRRLEHFRRAVGEEIIVKTIASVEPRRVKGALRSVADAGLTIDVSEIDGVDLADTESRVVALADVSTARTVFDWGPTPKLGGKQSNKGANKGHSKGAKGNNKKSGAQKSGQKSQSRSAAKAKGGSGSKNKSGPKTGSPSQQERGRR